MKRKSRLTVSEAPELEPVYERVLDALGDRTRRQIFARLRSGPKPVGELAVGLPVTRSAVSQHLKILKDAGLVNDHAEGTRRLYAVDRAGLATLRAFLELFWQDALQHFANQAAAGVM